MNGPGTLIKTFEVIRLVPWEDPEGWDGEGGRSGDRDGEHM